MVHRIVNPSKSNSFFLFGARGVGKSTFIREQFLGEFSQNSGASALPHHYLSIDLLNPQTEDLYARNPQRLAQEILALPTPPDWVFIDEVQKVPRILDVVHQLIFERKQKFILTGSSARKLKRGAANLLAGRAFLYHLYPFCVTELGDAFNLDFSLCWGHLPKIFEFESDSDRKKFLKSYCLNYLNEEIRSEQLVRKLDPFRSFLEITAQASGKIVNYRKIAGDIGVDTKTVQAYFEILEDTLLGFYLPAFHQSVRKSQRVSPKFFLFDIGVKRALEGSLESAPVPQTSYFGQIFEEWLIIEIFKLNSLLEKDFKLSYFETHAGGEIDLILSKAKTNFLIEIKSSDQIDESEVRKLSRAFVTFPKATQAFYLSRNPTQYKIEGVTCMHYLDFLKDFTSKPDFGTIIE